MRKIGIDARWMINNHRGMGRFANALVQCENVDLIKFSDNNNSKETNLICQGPSFFPFWEQIVLPKLVKKYKVNTIIYPYNTGVIFNLSEVRKIVVIHDLIFMKSLSELPLSLSSYQVFGRLYRRLIVPMVAKKADLIITVSDYTKSELISRFSIPENKIKVIPNSISDDWFIPHKNLRDRDSYYLTVAGEAPSKNLRRLFKVIQKILPDIDSSFKLLVAGVKSCYIKVFENECQDLGIIEHIEFLGFLSDDELKSKYRDSSGFIFPSLFEGFGIPILEAMSSGTPICCSKSTSLPEVAGHSALYFDPNDTICMASVLKNFINEDISLKEERIRIGLILADKYKASNVNKQILEFWSEFFET